MAEYLKEPERIAMRDELAMRVMAAWAQVERVTLWPVAEAIGLDFDQLKDKAKTYAESALAIADGFMAARTERLQQPDRGDPSRG